MVALPLIARGDALVLTTFFTDVPSPIEGVSSRDWSRLGRILEVQDREAETERGLGAFAMRPRRLGDLGYMTNLRPITTTHGHKVWIGDFVLPHTRDRFLANRVVQYNVLVQSITRYVTDIRSAQLPEDMTMSGALAILHDGGPWALRAWSKGSRSAETTRLFNLANGIF